MRSRIPFPSVRIDADRIVDDSSLHAAFAEAMGCPSFYGPNMNA